MKAASLRHRLEYWAFCLTRAKWSFLSEGLAARAGALTGWIAGSVLRIRRREVDEHIAVAFPTESPSWRRTVARRSYMHLGREVATLFRMTSWSKDEILERVNFVGFGRVQEAAREGKGVILLTGHLGNWELAGAGLAALGFPIDAVVKGMSNRRFETDLFSTRKRLGVGVIEMSEAPKEVLRSLGRGRVVALLGDQNAHRHGVFLPFFDKLAATARGPALFALRTGVPVFVGFVIRSPGWKPRYTLAAVGLEYETTGDADKDVRSLLLSYNRVLEDAIRATPDQYFWQHKRWKTRPPEEQASDR